MCQETCRRAGLKAAASTYTEFEDQPAIVVQRFDRRTGPDGRVARVHQEDMCQALGLDPSKKYPSDGGPSVPEIARLLGSVDSPSVLRFARAVTADYLLGAPDAHAKNHAVLLAGRAVELAPMYDVASGLVANTEGRLRYRKAAMSIGGENRFGEVEARHWEKFASQCSLPVDEVRALVTELATTIPDAMADVIRTIPATAQGRRVLVDQVRPRVTRLCEVTVETLHAARRDGSRVVAPVMDELERVGASTPAPGGRVLAEQQRKPRGAPDGGPWAVRPRSEPEVFLDTDD